MLPAVNKKHIVSGTHSNYLICICFVNALLSEYGLNGWRSNEHLILINTYLKMLQPFELIIPMRLNVVLHTGRYRSSLIIIMQETNIYSNFLGVYAHFISPYFHSKYRLFSEWEWELREHGWKYSSIIWFLIRLESWHSMQVTTKSCTEPLSRINHSWLVAPPVRLFDQRLILRRTAWTSMLTSCTDFSRLPLKPSFFSLCTWVPITSENSSRWQPNSFAWFNTDIWKSSHTIHKNEMDFHYLII